jgi:hypothetical protein
MNRVAKPKRTCRLCTDWDKDDAIQRQMALSADAGVSGLPYVKGLSIDVAELEMYCPTFRSSPTSSAREGSIERANILTQNLQAALRVDGMTVDNPERFAVIMRYLAMPRQLGYTVGGVHYYYTLDEIFARPDMIADQDTKWYK